MFKKVLTASSGLLLLPMFAFAQFNNSDELTQFGDRILYFINSILVPFIFAVALLLFIYGMYLYFFYGRSEEDARKTGRNYIIWAVLAFVVMVSVWGIVNLLAGGLNLKGDINNQIPDGIQSGSSPARSGYQR